jgi:hypothetical protein
MSQEVPMNDSPLARRRARVKMIRTRLAVGSAALFVAAFGGITAQLASGHDPALSSSNSSSASTTTASSPSRAASAATPAATTQAATPLSPVTTSQS